jgi:monofunctional chorismate mutase
MEEPTGPTACRGIRGAITVEGAGVDEATAELLEAVVQENACRLDDVAAVIFTVSDDLEGWNPAAAARRNGWDLVPLLVVREHDQSVERCLRVLVLWNTTKVQRDIRHVYLRGARALRPDLAGRP